MERGAWWATAHGVIRVGHDLATKPHLSLPNKLVLPQDPIWVPWVPSHVSLGSCVTISQAYLYSDDIDSFEGTIQVFCRFPSTGTCWKFFSQLDWGYGFGLDEAQAGIKIARRNINLKYADDTTLKAESEEELKSPLIKVKEETEKLA